jgi:hypothetical protein
MAGVSEGRRKGGRKKITGQEKYSILVRIEEMEKATHFLEGRHHKLHGQLREIRRKLRWMDFNSFDPN